MTHKEPVSTGSFPFSTFFAKDFLFSISYAILTIMALVIRYNSYWWLDEREDLLLYRTQTNTSRVSSGYLRKAAGYSDFFIEQGYQYFGAGGALGFDTLAAQTVLHLKQRYPCIKLILVLPCKDQATRWRANDVKEYERIKSHADKIVYTAERYYNGWMQKRNRHLVDGSSLCICYLAKQEGGTAYTVQYASEKGLRVVNIVE